MVFLRACRAIRLKLRSLFGLSRVEQELDNELQFHIDLQIQEYTAKGMPPDEARSAAMRTFNGIEQRKEECRDARGVSIIENAIRDFRYGVRTLLKSPGFALTAAGTLSLGIGAATAVFSVVYGVVLQPLPYPQPERLVGLWTVNPQLSPERVLAGPANFKDWRENNTVFEDMALIRQIGNFNLIGKGEPERVQGARVTPSLFRVLGVQPMLGRAFTDEEGKFENTVLLSHGLWQRQYGADSSIIGRVIRLNGNPYTVAGVMPPDFAYPHREFQLWTPLTINPEDYKTRQNFSFLAVGRLKDGVLLTRAQTEMSAIAARLAEQYPENKGIGVRLSPLLDDVAGGVRTQLYVLLAAVLCLVMIGCANLTNLVMTRAFGRRHELVVRTALGASRSRLVLQSVMEFIPLLAAGGAGGIVLTKWMLGALIPFLPTAMPRLEAIHIDWHVLAFSAAMLFATALSTGIFPTMQVVRWNYSIALRESSRTTAGGGSRIRDVLVVTQIAAVLILMVGSALLIRSFVALTATDPGFHPNKVLSLQMAIPRSKYSSDASIAQFCRQILERVSSLPGVDHAGMVNRLPLGGVDQFGSVEFEGTGLTANQTGAMDWRTVTPDYFRALGIPLVQGRFFDESDTADRPMSGIIDEQVARRVWPNENPIGKRFRVPYPGEKDNWISVVGVVGHLRHNGLGSDPRPQIYWNYQQRAQDRVALVVRAAQDPQSIAASVVSAIHTIDAEQPVYDVRPMNDVVERSVSPQWFTTALFTRFASIALILATFGVYGVLTYTAGMRAREIGIRMALGARRREVIWMVLRYGGSLAITGISIGLAGAFLLSRTLAALLYGIGTTDPFSFFAVPALLLIVSLAASGIPAYRASSVDPLSVLRTE